MDITHSVTALSVFSLMWSVSRVTAFADCTNCSFYGMFIFEDGKVKKIFQESIDAIPVGLVELSAADACENIGCGEYSICTPELSNIFSCKCNNGYFVKASRVKFQCLDINECDGVNSCHEHADCFNTEGGHNCTCGAGFEGNGTHCDDIDECANDLICHVFAICDNTIGSYECTCSFMTTGDGKYCRDFLPWEGIQENTTKVMQLEICAETSLIVKIQKTFTVTSSLYDLVIEDTMNNVTYTTSVRIHFPNDPDIGSEVEFEKVNVCLLTFVLRVSSELAVSARVIAGRLDDTRLSIATNVEHRYNAHTIRFLFLDIAG